VYRALNAQQATKVNVFSHVPGSNGTLSVNGSFVSQLCVAIPSARRYASSGKLAPRNYIREMIQIMWRDLPHDQMDEALVYVMNVDREPKDHKEPARLEKYFKGVKAVASTVDIDELAKVLPDGAVDPDEQVVMTKTKQVWRAKEVLDNLALLELCRDSGRPYTLFLEDDVRPTTNMWAKLERFVKQMPDDYGLLDLYNPGVWEEEDKEYLNGEEYNFFCCTQAMLFANLRIEGIVNILHDGYMRAPVDHLLVEYLHNNGTNATVVTNKPHDKHVYVAVPNLFQHVGAYSSLAERTLDPPEVAHESLSWEALVQSHSSVITTTTGEKAAAAAKGGKWDETRNEISSNTQQQHLRRGKVFKNDPEFHMSTSFVE